MSDRESLHVPTLEEPRFQRARRPAVARNFTRTLGIAEGAVPKEASARDRALRRLLALSDVLAAALSLLLVVGLLGADDRLRLPALLIPPFVVVASWFMGLYGRDEVVLAKTTLDEVPRLFQLATLSTLLVFLGEGAFVDGDLGPGQGLGLWAAFLVCATACRAAVRALGVQHARPERCLLLGDDDEFGRVYRTIRHGLGLNVCVVGAVRTRELAVGPAAGHGLVDLVRAHGAERVIVASGALESEQLLEIVREMKAIGVKVSVKPRMLEVLGSATEFEEVHGDAFLGVRRFELSPAERRVKRAMDFAGAALLLLVTAPWFALIALLIKAEDRGPVFFRQERVGEDGRRFRIWKFRTMVPDAEARKAALAAGGAAELFKLRDDPRVTRFGRLLRRTSLDELPQLLNVLCGEMALVGPRPLVVDEDSMVVGWHRRRLHLTPGMTGMWQTLGARVPLRDMLALDYLYIVNWSPWRDVQILLRTAVFVVQRRGM